MATSRIALASVLDTVAQTANAFTQVVTTTTKGIGMLDALVTKASNEQALRHKAGRHTFVKNLIRESASEQAIADLQVIDFCSKSAEHKKMYEKNFDEFSTLFAEDINLKPSE